MLPNIKNNSAMTLVETLFCAVVFAVMMAACMALLFRGWDAWQTSSTQVQMTQALTQSADWLANDLRQSGATVVNNVPADNNVYTQITFATAQSVSNGTVVWNPSINYALGGTNGHQLVRTQNSQTHMVADNIISLQFFRSSAMPNIVNIQLTASVPTYRGSQHLTSTLNEEVLLRNT